MTQITVRKAAPADAELIVEFVRKLAKFEKAPLSEVKLTAADVLRDGFGAQPRFEVVIAEHDLQPAGFALFFPNYSTWVAKPGIYIEDIFVEPQFRKLGVGRRLIAAVAEIARARGCARIDLAVLHWNPAREFYQRLGFGHAAEWLIMRLDAAAIAALEPS